MAEFIIGLLWLNYFEVFTEDLFCARYYSLLYLRYKNEKDMKIVMVQLGICLLQDPKINEKWVLPILPGQGESQEAWRVLQDEKVQRVEEPGKGIPVMCKDQVGMEVHLGPTSSLTGIRGANPAPRKEQSGEGSSAEIK